MRKNRFPRGWNETRVRQVLKHYEEQTEEEAVAEDEAAFEDPHQTMMQVPSDLVPEVSAFIAKHQHSKQRLKTA